MLSGLSLLLSLPCGGLRWPGQAGLAQAYVLHGMLTEGERASAFLGAPGPTTVRSCCRDVMPILERSQPASRTFLVLGVASCLACFSCPLGPTSHRRLRCPDREPFPIQGSSLPSITPLAFWILDSGFWALGPGHFGTCARSPRPGNLEHGPRKHTISHVADQVLFSKWWCLDVPGDT